MGMMDRLSLLVRAPVTAQAPRGGRMDRIGVGIGHALVRHLQVSARGRGLVVGPRVIAYGYHLDSLTASVMRQAQSADLLAVLEHQVGVEWVACHRARGLFWYSIPNPAPFTVPATAFEGHGLEAAIGVDRMCQPVDVDFERTPHLLVAMPTGGGKTTATQALLHRLCAQNAPADLRLIVVASRIPQWQPLLALPHLWGIVHHNDSAPVLDWVLREVEHREALGLTTPHVMLVLDDAHSAVTRGGILSETMTTVSQNARAAGIHLIITAHGTDTKNLGSADVERNIGRRIIAATSASNAAQMTGRGGTGAHRLLGEGEAISVDGPREQPVTLAVVAPDDFYALGARWGMNGCEPAPWSLQPPPTAPNRSQPLPTVATAGWERPNLAVVRPESPPAAPTVVRLPRREPTPGDLATVRANFALCAGSKSRTCRETWGAKDGETWRWLAAALAAEEDDA